MSDYQDQLAEVESELWAALDALQQEDLVVVRQCLDRAKHNNVMAWRSAKSEGSNVQGD